MNVFCHCLSNSIFKKFNLEADVFISKKKNLAHIAFVKLLMSFFFFFFHELIEFVEHYWRERKDFF